MKFHRTPWFTPTRDFNAEDVVFSINRVLGHDTYLPTLSDDVVTYKNPQYKIFHEQAKKVHFPYFESIKLNQKLKASRQPILIRSKLTCLNPMPQFCRILLANTLLFSRKNMRIN